MQLFLYGGLFETYFDDCGLTINYIISVLRNVRY